MKKRKSSSRRMRREKGGFLVVGGEMLFCCVVMVMTMMGPLQVQAETKLETDTSVHDDVTALLDFKRASVKYDRHDFLSNWKSVDDDSSPCSWRGVTCNDDSRVTALNLTDGGIVGDLYLAPLTALPYLRQLGFRRNFFTAGDLTAANSHPCLFEVVDLSYNNLSDHLRAPSFLHVCDRLRSVDLSGNLFTGGDGFRFGSSLLQLDLSRNRIGDDSVLIDVLGHCGNLQLLNFSSNKLTGRLLSPGSVSFSNCEKVTKLDLSYNLLSGDVPNAISGLISVVDLSHNNFSSVQFERCENLTILNLSHNSLTNFSISRLSTCQLLETVDVSYNALRSKIPGVVLGKLKNLRRLSLAHNQFFGEIPSELGGICGTLEELDLSWNTLSGGFPLSFASCSALYSLSLGNNQFYGDFVDTVISKLLNLRYLYVPFSNLSGPVPVSLKNCTKLEVLDLSSNAFTGDIPSELCSSSTISTLVKILLPNNFLSGTIPMEIGNCKNLVSIDLSFNMLTGTIPLQIWNLPKLSDLVMWANNLTGEIPEGICVNAGNLEMLILNNNLITGTIPRSISKCTNLIWVSLSSNRLTGEIPDGIGNLLNLAILQMGNNSLSGKIPLDLGKCSSLIWLDLNSNNLTGPIPLELANQTGLVIPGLVSGKQFAFVRNEGGTECRGAGGLVEFEGVRSERLANHPMVHSCASTRIYTGLTVYTFTSNGSMIYLDLSYNTFSGPIPENFGSMNYLQVLNLGHNRLTEKIPDTFGGLKAIGVLDLSHNNLQGFVPGSLGTLSFLSDLDVSNNNLTGLIPSGGQLTTFPASRYENNSGLCGLPLLPCGSGAHTLPGFHGRDEKQSMAAGMIVGIIVSFLCILGLALALYRTMKRQEVEEKRNKYIESLPTSSSSSWKQLSSVPEPLSINVATFETPLRKLTFAHLLEATNGFSADTLVGSGGFGEVYKAQLKDGCVVAIKKLIHVTGQGDREFTAEMETIGKIKHRNLVPLLGYCKVGDERLLVYEYMKWGSLESVLHDRAKGKLDWLSRKKIAIGSARGLAFLHHSCIPHIIHRDMKSSNVLLDENFEARVSDFGMARLVNALDTHLSVSTLAGTPGYVPPEYYQSFRCTTKGDVYSYGVILLELLSGKRPIDPLQFGDDNNLVGWAKQLHRENRGNEILDPELTSRKSGEVELYQYLKITFECLDDKPFRRPTMIQVMAMFKELQIDSENDILDGFSVKHTVLEETREREFSSSGQSSGDGNN